MAKDDGILRIVLPHISEWSIDYVVEKGSWATHRTGTYMVGVNAVSKGVRSKELAELLKSERQYEQSVPGMKRAGSKKVGNGRRLFLKGMPIRMMLWGIPTKPKEDDDVGTFEWGSITGDHDRSVMNLFLGWNDVHAVLGIMRHRAEYVTEGSGTDVEASMKLYGFDSISDSEGNSGQCRVDEFRLLP